MWNHSFLLSFPWLSIPFHGYFHVLWEYRKSHPKTQLLKAQFLLGKSNTYTNKCQNQAHSHILHWNEHISQASVLDSVASYKCPSHSSFIMWIHKNQLHGHQFTQGCIHVDSSQRLHWEEVMSLPQLRDAWTPLQITTGQQVPASHGLLLLHARPSILELGWKNIKTLNRVKGIQREKSFTV